MFREVHPFDFAVALTTARIAMDPAKALCVTVPEIDPGLRCFLSADGLSGFALTPHSIGTDYLGSVFRHPACPAPVFGDMLEAADMLSPNGLMLDCFAPLRPVYERHGFAVESSAPFDPAFKPEGWDVEAHGTPEVLFMFRPNALHPVAIAA